MNNKNLLHQGGRMLSWQVRPSEIANFLNPAFCTLLLHESIFNFRQEQIINAGLPYPLSLLVLPIVLHKSTREALPKTTASVMSDWLQQNSRLIVGFAERTHRLTLFTKEALIFGMQKEIIDIDKNGDLISLPLSSKVIPWPSDSETIECRKRAGLLGRWFARSGNTVTIFRQWGIRL